MTEENKTNRMSHNCFLNNLSEQEPNTTNTTFEVLTLGLEPLNMMPGLLAELPEQELELELELAQFGKRIELQAAGQVQEQVQAQVQGQGQVRERIGRMIELLEQVQVARTLEGQSHIRHLHERSPELQQTLVLA